MVNFENGNTPINDANLNKMQTDLNQEILELQINLKQEILKLIFPIGSTYITQDNTNPNSILGFGTWERLKGKVCLGLDEDDTNLNSIGKTGGEKQHTITFNELPNKPFIVNETGLIGLVAGSTATVATQNGGGQPINIMQPYEVVGYMWIRRS